MNNYQISNDHTAHVTVDDAKAYAEQNIGWNYHAYIYKCAGEIVLMWHHEDRYVHSYMPFNSQILWHGKVEYNGNEKTISWERRGNNNQDDFDVIADVLGSDIANALKDLGALDMDIKDE